MVDASQDITNTQHNVHNHAQVLQMVVRLYPKKNENKSQPPLLLYSIISQKVMGNLQ